MFVKLGSLDVSDQGQNYHASQISKNLSARPWTYRGQQQRYASVSIVKTTAVRRFRRCCALSVGLDPAHDRDRQ